MKENKLLFPLICISICCMMYCIAFHNERNKNRELQETIIKLNKK